MWSRTHFSSTSRTWGASLFEQLQVWSTYYLPFYSGSVLIVKFNLTTKSNSKNMIQVLFSEETKNQSDSYREVFKMSGRNIFPYFSLAKYMTFFNSSSYNRAS